MLHYDALEALMSDTAILKLIVAHLEHDHANNVLRLCTAKLVANFLAKRNKNKEYVTKTPNNGVLLFVQQIFGLLGELGMAEKSVFRLAYLYAVHNATIWVSKWGVKKCDLYDIVAE